MDLLTIIRKWGPGSPSKGASERKESATKPHRELVSREDTQRLPHKIQQSQKPTRDSPHQTLSNVPECTDGKQSTIEKSIDHEMELDESQSLETITKLQNEIAEYRHQIASFQKCIEQLKHEKSQDVQEFERVVRKQNHCLEELDSKRRRQHKEHEILRQEYESLLNDNQALRDYIDRTRNRQPVHSDDEYIARMGSLNHKTKSWITSLSKSRRSEDLELDYSIIQEALGWNSYGKHFQSWVNEDPNRLRSILQKPQHRTFLIRQLIWSEFSETIFSPFCFGLRNEVDHLLHRIMDEICVQVLGKGVLKETKSNQEELQKELEERVGNLLSLLFPEGKNLKRKLKDFVDRAVDLANLMTEEKCLFFCDMVSIGQSCNLDEMHPYDQEEGLVKMCMFPVFGLQVRNQNGVTERKVLVKAEVELDASITWTVQQIC